jgi:ABC-type amino acid transport substrate-binding protein
VAFPKSGDQKLVDALTNTLEDMKNEGLVDEIIQKYGLDPKPIVWGK